MQKKAKINIVSLGCSKNTVDSEKLAYRLKEEGFLVGFELTKPSFDWVVINTCGFIDKAKQESIDIILSFAKLKEKHNFRIIVFGCLAQRYSKELKDSIPEIDAIFGLLKEKQIVEYIVNNSLAIISKPTHLNHVSRCLSTPTHYAYLKIAEGCDRRCSFCAIPLIKGKYISKPIEDIVLEAQELINQGVKELILIAQDTSCYGIDIYGKQRLYDLIVELEKLNINWIRLQYSYPNQFPLEVLSLMTPNSKLCHYLDMPLQHINNRILHSMNRNITSNEIIDLINICREKIKDLSLRTTLIVGYPSETENEFNELLSFVKNIRFERMGAFCYSKQEGTKAAELKDNVPEEEKEKRLDVLTSLQEDISLEKNDSLLGKIVLTLIDRIEGEYYVGRTQYDSPEVDNEVLIDKQKQTLEIGKFYNVKINEVMSFDLYGQVVN